jgi:cytochrome P450
MFSKTLLDIIGRASLGVDLGSLSAQGSPFSDLYSQIFEQSPVGQVIFLINIFIPVRSWLPLKANTDFLHATSEIRRRLRDTIKQRRVEIFGSDKEKTKTRHEFTEEGSRDLLTFMIYERSEGENKWSDEDILGHVSTVQSSEIPKSASHLTRTSF